MSHTLPEHVPLTPSDLRDLLKFTVALAHRAGALILEGADAVHRTASVVSEKKNAVDLVTEYDVKVEELVKREIAENYPYFKFIGEESFAAGAESALTDAPTFCVDPIDGTTNFVHGFPFACISLGVLDHRRPVLGVVYNPFLRHLYTGVRGQGAFLIRGDGAPERLPLGGARPLPTLQQALIAIEWGSDRSAPNLNLKADSFARLAGDPTAGVPRGVMAHSLRSLGSAALNFAMVAQGGLDMYWEIGCWPWDVCAGIVIAQEAGGFVTGSVQSPHDGAVTESILLGRKFLVIRDIADTENEKGIDAQKRIAREFYETVEDVPAV